MVNERGDVRLRPRGQSMVFKHGEVTFSLDWRHCDLPEEVEDREVDRCPPWGDALKVHGPRHLPATT